MPRSLCVALNLLTLDGVERARVEPDALDEPVTRVRMQHGKLPLIEVRIRFEHAAHEWIEERAPWAAVHRRPGVRFDDLLDALDNMRPYALPWAGIACAVAAVGEAEALSVCALVWSVGGCGAFSVASADDASPLLGAGVVWLASAGRN